MYPMLQLNWTKLLACNRTNEICKKSMKSLYTRKAPLRDSDKLIVNTYKWDSGCRWHCRVSMVPLWRGEKVYWFRKVFISWNCCVSLKLLQSFRSQFGLLFFKTSNLPTKGSNMLKASDSDLKIRLQLRFCFRFNGSCGTIVKMHDNYNCWVFLNRWTLCLQ